MCLAVPGKLLSIEGDDPILKTGKVSFGGVVKPVSLAYLPEAQVGDYVVVHVGFAISRLDEEEANKVFEYLKEIGEIEAQMDAAGSPEDPGAPDGVSAEPDSSPRGGGDTGGGAKSP